MDYFSPLPDELHVMILKALDPEEWRVTKFAHYRLTSRRFATIGAQQMFETFQFHPTNVALELMCNVASLELKKYVKILDYDGVLRAEDGSIVATTEETKVRVFRDVTIGFGGDNSAVYYIATQALPCALFQAPYTTPAFTASCANITNLLLSFHVPASPSGRDADVHALPAFLAGLERLQSLQLSFWPDGPKYAPVTLSHIVPADHTWRKLKFLMLEAVRFKEDELAALLARHARSLENVYFKFMPFYNADPDQHSLAREMAKRDTAWLRVRDQIGDMEVLKGGHVTAGDALMPCETAVGVRMERRGIDVEIKTDMVDLWTQGSEWIRDLEKKDEQEDDAEPEEERGEEEEEDSDGVV